MNVKILEENAGSIVFEVDGMTHTIANALKFELYTDTAVKAAGYHISHPLVGKPQFVVETKKGTAARKSVDEAVKRLDKTFDTIGKKAKELK